MTKGDDGNARRSRTRVRAALPRAAAHSRDAACALVEEHADLFREQALIQLGERPEVDTELTLFLSRLRGMEEEPNRDDALPWLMRRFREQLYAARDRLARETASSTPRDAVLGELDDEVVAAIEELPSSQREAMRLAALEHLTPAAIARRLNATPKAATMRLFRARLRLRQRFPDRFPCLLGWLAVARSLPQRLMHRVRHVGTQGAVSLPALDHLAQVIVAAVLAATCLVQPPPMSGGGGTPDQLWQAAGTVTAAAARPAGEPVQEARALGPGSTQSLPLTARSGSAAAPAVPVLAGRTAATEPPEDAQLLDIAAAPSASGSPTLVALGVGRSCACSVLFRSADGGATWESRDAPPGAQQVVLPPSYPADPRIFIGSRPDGTAPDYVLLAFGSPALSLPAPPGELALSAAFDHGDDRAFIASRSALWSVDAGTWRPTVELRYPGAANPALVTTATGDVGSAVLVEVPAAPTLPAAGNAVGDPPGLYLCSAAGIPGCVQRASTTAWDTLASAPLGDSDTTLVGLLGRLPQSSTNGGGSTRQLSLLPGTTAALGLTVAGGRTWGLFASSSRQARIGWVADGGGPWHDVTGADPVLAQTASLVTLSRDEVIALLVNGAMRCSADAGLTWTSRCPPR